MARTSWREKIVESGVRTVHELGYAGAGIRDITSEAGVPQGCFTNHFRSKEAFGVAVVDRYHEGLQSLMDRTLRDPARAPVARLRAYFDAQAEKLAAAGWRYGCLIGNLCLEVAEGNELLRERLAMVSDALTRSFAETVRAGQAAGEIRRDLDADDVATFLLSSWEGAMMRMKVDRSPRPIEQFERVLFATVLAAPLG